MQGSYTYNELMRYFYVYIMSNHHQNLYVGITSDLIKRVWEHKNNVVEGFTQKYQCHILVYYEILEDPREAIQREKQLKRWKRDWKLKLIYEKNPKFVDLYKTLL
jgi:putative endonuclease